MADTRTVEELADFLNNLVEDGYGKAPVYFDTCAQTYHYHMAKIGTVYAEDIDGTKLPYVILHEENKPLNQL